MQQVVTNSTVNGVLSSLFALLTLLVLASAIPVWFKAFKSGGLPTTEIPPEPSHLVAVGEIFATPQEKLDVRAYEDSERELASTGRPR